MGHFNVKVKVCNLDESRCEELEALVDTGATSLAIPQSVVGKLNLPIVGEALVEDGEGKISRRPRAMAVIEVRGQKTATGVVVMPDGARPVLGVAPLEELGFKVNPVTKELEEAVILF